VVMLRSLGIPARIAVGYVLRSQDRLPDTNTYAITEGNAFAWPEVYFPGLGWVEFNPTPSEPAITRPGNDDQDVVPDDALQVPPEDEIPPDLLPPTDPAPSALDQLQQGNGSNLVGTVLMILVLAFVGGSLAGVVAFEMVWQRGMAGLDYPSQVWEKTQRLARWARIPSYPNQTPRVYVERLEMELPDVDDLRFLGEAYVRSRYGAKKLAEPERERLARV